MLATLAGIAVAAALLVWSLRGVHPGEVARHIRDAHPAPLLLAVIVATLTFPIRMPQPRGLDVGWHFEPHPCNHFLQE